MLIENVLDLGKDGLLFTGAVTAFQLGELLEQVPRLVAQFLWGAHFHPGVKVTGAAARQPLDPGAADPDGGAGLGPLGDLQVDTGLVAEARQSQFGAQGGLGEIERDGTDQMVVLPGVSCSRT